MRAQTAINVNERRRRERQQKNKTKQQTKQRAERLCNTGKSIFVPLDYISLTYAVG